jgi:large subunit ribosomal protein L22
MASQQQQNSKASEAHLRNFRMAPRKLSVVADLVRGKNVGAALNILRFTPRAASEPLAKLIKSAVANATDLSKGQVDVDTLYVKTISVDQAKTARRYMPRAMGRATRINKKSSHVHVVLAENKRK